MAVPIAPLPNGLKLLSTGISPNDGLGDTLPDACIKLNDNAHITLTVNDDLGGTGIKWNKVTRKFSLGLTPYHIQVGANELPLNTTEFSVNGGSFTIGRIDASKITGLIPSSRIQLASNHILVGNVFKQATAYPLSTEFRVTGSQFEINQIDFSKIVGFNANPNAIALGLNKILVGSDQGRGKEYTLGGGFEVDKVKNEVRIRVGIDEIKASGRGAGRSLQINKTNDGLEWVARAVEQGKVGLYDIDAPNPLPTYLLGVSPDGRGLRWYEPDQSWVDLLEYSDYLNNKQKFLALALSRQANILQNDTEGVDAFNYPMTYMEAGAVNIIAANPTPTPPPLEIPTCVSVEVCSENKALGAYIRLEGQEFVHACGTGYRIVYTNDKWKLLVGNRTYVAKQEGVTGIGGIYEGGGGEEVRVLPYCYVGTKPCATTPPATLPPAAAMLMVWVDGTLVNSGQIVNYGNVPKGSRKEKTFVISNIGAQDLRITNFKLGEGYSLIGEVPSVISGGRAATIKVGIVTTEARIRKTTLEFNTDTTSVPLYKINIEGAVVLSTSPTPTPSPTTGIEIRVGDTVLTHGSASVDYGEVIVGEPKVKSFVIRNTGTQPLDIRVTVPEGYRVHKSVPTQIAVGDAVSLDIGIKADEIRSNVSGDLVVINGDSSKSPFSIRLTGSVTAPPPEIKLYDGVNLVSSGSGIVSFGKTQEGTPVEKVLVITNTGGRDLVLTDPVIPTGFAMVGSLPQPIGRGMSGVLKIKLNAESSGNKSGEVKIKTNTTPAEYSFTVSGVVETVSRGEIEVSWRLAEYVGTELREVGERQQIANGGTIQLGTAVTRVRTNDSIVSAGRRVAVIYVNNTGQGAMKVGPLTIQNPTNKRVFKTSYDYTPIPVEDLYRSTYTIVAGGFIKFNVILDGVDALPIGEGDYMGQLSLRNTDSDENPYVINLNGSIRKEYIPPPPSPPLEGNLYMMGFKNQIGGDWWSLLKFDMVKETSAKSTVSYQATSTRTLYKERALGVGKEDSLYWKMMKATGENAEDERQHSVSKLDKLRLSTESLEVKSLQSGFAGYGGVTLDSPDYGYFVGGERYYQTNGVYLNTLNPHIDKLRYLNEGVVSLGIANSYFRGSSAETLTKGYMFGGSDLAGAVLGVAESLNFTNDAVQTLSLDVATVKAQGVYGTATANESYVYLIGGAGGYTSTPVYTNRISKIRLGTPPLSHTVVGEGGPQNAQSGSSRLKAYILGGKVKERIQIPIATTPKELYYLVLPKVSGGVYSKFYTVTSLLSINEGNLRLSRRVRWSQGVDLQSMPTVVFTRDRGDSDISRQYPYVYVFYLIDRGKANNKVYTGVDDNSSWFLQLDSVYGIDIAKEGTTISDNRGWKRIANGVEVVGYYKNGVTFRGKVKEASQNGGYTWRETDIVADYVMFRSKTDPSSLHALILDMLGNVVSTDAELEARVSWLIKGGEGVTNTESYIPTMRISSIDYRSDALVQLGESMPTTAYNSETVRI